LFFYLVGQSCINSILRFGPNGFNQGWGDRGESLTLTSENFYRIKHKLSKAHIQIADYQKLFKEFGDDPNALWFIDPPYLETNHLYGSDGFTEDSFLAELLQLKGKIIYTDMYTEKKEEILKDWRIIKLRDLISIRPDKTAGTVRGDEVMFCNFANNELPKTQPLF